MLITTMKLGKVCASTKALINKHFNSLAANISAETMRDELENFLPSALNSNAQQVVCQEPVDVRTMDSARPFSEIPGPRGVPLLGNALKYSKLGPYKFEKILDNRLHYMHKYGKIYKEKLGSMWIVHLFQPADIATMFKEEGKYPSRGQIASIEVTYLKRKNKAVGFAFLDGEEWARQRGCVQQPMMHPSSASRYLHMQVPAAQDFVHYLDLNRRPADGVIPDLYEKLFAYTMEAIGMVCFDRRLGLFDDKLNDSTKRLSEAIKETFICFRSCMFSFPWHRYFRSPMYRRFEKAADIMKGIMKELVHDTERRVHDRIQNASSSPMSGCPFSRNVTLEKRSLFEVLMHDSRIGRDLLENFIMMIFRTGVDSTGNALAFLLYNLAANPAKQEEVIREIDTILPDGKPLNADALSKMVYLKAALKESFRLNFPVFGGSGRVLDKDVVFSGYNVPKGTFLFANLAAMSRLSENYPSPTEYQPERWLRDVNSEHDAKLDMASTAFKESAFITLPFSHGLRACPGKRFAEQGLYLAVVSILQRFRLAYHGEAIGMLHMPFTQPDKSLDISFIRRTKD